MVSFSAVFAASMALLTTTIAAPTAEFSTVTAVEFQGLTVYYATPNVTALTERSNLQPRAPPTPGCLMGVNDCGDSSFEPDVSPYPSVSDCQVLANFAYGLNTWWVSSQNLVWAGSCAFYAETSNSLNTGIGSQDIGDLVNDSIAKLQVRTSNQITWEGMLANIRQGGGLIAAQGTMGCTNVFTGIFGQGPSSVRWKVRHS